MKTRQEALANLLAYRAPVEELLQDIRQFSWDSDKELVTLTADHIRNVISRYVSGELTEQHLEDWANAIEGREDIAFATTHREALEEAIFQLANPLLTHPITKESVQALLRRVQ